MSDDCIGVVAVRCCCTTDGAGAEARFETHDGRALALRMTRKAIAECATCFSVASLRSRAQPLAPDEVMGIPAAVEGVAPLAGEVLVALTVDVVGTTLFVLSQQDAVILAAQLLDAAKDNPGAAMPQ